MTDDINESVYHVLGKMICTCEIEGNGFSNPDSIEKFDTITFWAVCSTYQTIHFQCCNIPKGHAIEQILLCQLKTNWMW